MTGQFVEQAYIRYEQDFMRISVLFFFMIKIIVAMMVGTVVCTEVLTAQMPQPSLTFPKAYYAIHLDDKPVSILTTVEIVGRLYVEPITLATALDCELRAEGVLAVLLTPSHVLAFAVDAHVVGVQAANSDTVSLTQMLHPVALQAGRIFLPFDDVLRLLADNGVYEVDERDADVFLHSNGYIPPAQAFSKEVSKNDPPAEQKAPTTKQFRKPTRNLYILPDDVKRRDMDSLPKKTSFLNPQTDGHAIFACSNFSRRFAFSAYVAFSRRFASTLLLSRLLTQSSKKTPPPALAPKNVGKPTTPKQTGQNDNDFTSAKKKWALDVIVLDAGHGGKDGGTIGYGKTKEKDVALGIVKKLGAMLKKELQGTKIVYTRSDDTFVELDRRGQIANENGGKLFISVHCNSTPKKPSKANGFEVYILRPGRNDDAVRVAEMENAVIKLEDNPKRYKPLTDEQFIVVSMAQSAFVKYSDMAAAMVSAEVKRLHEIGVRGVNQAGFLVLVGASMPNMLIETGFLSNKKDEKLLKSERGQTRLASAICRAIKAYRARYEAQIKGQAIMGSTPTETKKKIVAPAAAPSSKKTPVPPHPVTNKKTSSSLTTTTSKASHK